MIDRILESFERLTKAFQAKANYAIPWEYAVSEATSTTFTGRATSTDCPHPDLVGIPFMPGIAGTLIKPAVGSLVGVIFLNGDPTRPRCVSWDQDAAELVAVLSANAAGTASNEVQFTPTGLVVSPGVVPPQAVALAPAVASFASAMSTLSSAIATFATAVDAVVPGAGTTMNTAALAAVSSLAALSGNFPTGFAATKLTTQ